MSATTIKINDETPKRQYTAAASQVTFDFPYPFFNDGDLEVYLTPNGQDADDTADLLTITTDYTVNGADTQDGGEIVLTSGATAGDIITIYRVVDVKRTSDYQTAGDLLAETLNTEQDTEIMIAQQLRSDIDRAPKIQKSDASGVDLTLPKPEAGKHLAWNSAATGLVNDDAPGQVVGAAYTDEVHTATAGQTVFTLTGITYTPGVRNLSVYLSGVRQQPGVDYIETNATTVTFTSGLTANDSVMFATADTVTNTVGQASGIAYTPDGTGAVPTNVQAKLRESVSVKDFGAVGDGVTNDSAAVQAAVTHANTNSLSLEWPDGTYLTTSSITNLHDVRHFGDGAIKRGADVFYVEPSHDDVNSLYVDDASGSDANDGLSSSEPMLTIQKSIDVIGNYKPIISRWKTNIAAGTYTEQLVFPDGLSSQEYYLEFLCPSTPGVQGDPSTWPVTGARLDGTGLGSTGISVGRYNKVYFEYLLIENWYDSGTAAIAQVYRGMSIDEFSFAYLYGCSAQGNGLDSIAITPQGGAVVTGGVIDGGRRGIDNTGGSLSLTSDRTTNYTTIKNGLEYGLYAKHNSRSVLDGAHFEDCGNVAGAENYGSALLAYKSGTSIDSKGCTFNRNNHCYNARGGHIARQPSLAETYGSGVDANTRIWKVNGFGEDDLINYESIAGRELQIDFADQSTSSTSFVDVVENSVDVPAGYFTSTEQYLEITIRGRNDGAGTAQVRPVLQSDAPTNYPLGTYDVAANTFFEIRIIVTPTTASAQKIQFNNTNATLGGNSIEDTAQALPADVNGWYFKVQGSVSVGTNTLVFTHASCKMWG